MNTFGPQPVLLRSLAVPAPDRWRAQLATFDPDGRRYFLQDVRPPDTGQPWGGRGSAEGPVRGARFGDQVALLWRREGALQMGTTDLSGQLVPQELIDVFQQDTSAGQGEKVRDYFVLVAMVLAASLSFSLRTAPLRPPRLPPGVALANPARRLVAWLVDFLPVSVVVRLVLPVPDLTLQQVTQLLQERRLPLMYWYAMVAALSLCVLYCAVAEYRFGTTLGKALLRLRVVDSAGQRLTIPQAALRNVFKIVELFALPGGILLLVPFITRSRQRLGDFLARTLVVTGKPTEDGAPGSDPPTPPPWDDRGGR